MMKKISYILLLTLTFLTACGSTSVTGATLETERLVIRDIAGNLSAERIDQNTNIGLDKDARKNARAPVRPSVGSIDI
jgi:hypothetical protein